MQAETRLISDQMVTLIQADPQLLEDIKTDPSVAVPKLVDAAEKQVPVYVGDKLLYRLAILVLGLLALIAALGSIVLVLAGKTSPEVLVALGSAAVGALVGLFATPPSSK